MKRANLVDSLKSIVHSRHCYRLWTIYYVLIFLLFISSSISAQTLLKAEYFFDTDPGVNNGTAITLAANTGTLTFTSSIPTTSLSQGFHQLGLRVKETGGRWSIFESRGFYITASTADAANITKAEYFFDADPGNGNGINIPVTAGATTNFTVSLPTTSLAQGFHFLAIRTKGIDGRWGVFEARGFYITGSTTDATNITKAEYFFDTDPGNGNGINIPVTAGATTNFTVSLPASLAPGFHFLAIRIKGADGKWGVFETRGFYVTGSTANAPDIKKAEYFFDTDPGSENGIALTIPTGATSNFTVSLPTTALTPGFHFLAIRMQGVDGRWSVFESRGFYISPTGTNAGDIVAAEYFFDDVDPGEGNGLSLLVSPTGAIINQVFDIPSTALVSGVHTVSIRVQGSDNIWSTFETKSFTVLACTPPSVPTTSNQARCGMGSVTLTATAGATGSQVYRWYDDAASAAVLFTGAAFTTPSLTATKSYYVSVFDPNTLCESARIEAKAMVSILTKPVINPSGTISLCAGSSVFLSAPTGFSQYTWSNGQTTQQILVTTAGDYTVQTGDRNCTSEISDPVPVNIISAASKPIITVTGSTTLCGSGSVELTGPAGFEYLWSTGATTLSITATQTGVFFLIVKAMGAGCSSLPSDPVVVTILTPPCTGGGGNNAPPTIDTKPLAAQIEGRVSIDLTKLVSDVDNNINFSSLTIIGNQTSRGVATFIDGSFFLQIDYSGNPFTGVDRITLEVCDLLGACAQQVIDIDVVGDVVVFNGVTPDGDGINDFMVIKYVDVVENASKNKVIIYNRWGDAVFDMDDYDNLSRVFVGQTNSGKDLPSGTYFYKIDFEGNSKSGFITLKR
ncbi:MAG: gliding motility-associated C-terminal domain-containing protein [Cyclobacteriaceae bacterium]|jgi:gliding motility-associated-like protein|nr:gliding motility-associated C-terminal domain-containing protein [Cyclobacteriaceae bacterium]